MNISVVIPAYNAAHTIRQTLDSCLQQSHAPYEIIVVDDCSTDDTAAIVKAYFSAHPDLSTTLVSFRHNQGPSAARNGGWGMASGDIISFLDADDTWHREKLKIISEVFSSNPEIAFLGHPYTLGSFEMEAGNLLLEKKSYTSVLLSNPFQSSCISVRKKAKELFDPEMRYCEDQEFSLRMAYKYGCYMLPLALTRLGRPQLTKGGASGNLWKMRKGELTAYSSIWKTNPLFSIAIPALWVFSLLKHISKLISR